MLENWDIEIQTFRSKFLIFPSFIMQKLPNIFILKVCLAQLSILVHPKMKLQVRLPLIAIVIEFDECVAAGRLAGCFHSLTHLDLIQLVPP